MSKAWRMNMFQPTKAKTIQAYLDSLPTDRRETIEFLDTFIKKAAPSLKPHFATNMLGYGTFPYKSYKNQMLYWPVIGLANQKNYISLYVCAVLDGEYAAEKHKDRLGKVSVGKSCIRFKKISDLNLDELKKVIQVAERHPGLIGVGASAK